MGGHVAHMDEKNFWRGERPLGRPRHGWEDNIKRNRAGTECIYLK
jgi:hypothetical protein